MLRNAILRIDFSTLRLPPPCMCHPHLKPFTPTLVSPTPTTMLTPLMSDSVHYKEAASAHVKKKKKIMQTNAALVIWLSNFLQSKQDMNSTVYGTLNSVITACLHTCELLLSVTHNAKIYEHINWISLWSILNPFQMYWIIWRQLYGQVVLWFWIWLSCVEFARSPCNDFFLLVLQLAPTLKGKKRC